MYKALAASWMIWPVVLGLMAFTAQAGDDWEIKVMPTVEREFDRRPDPASLRQDPEEKLLAEGFGKIGTIESTYVTQRCYPGKKGAECKTYSHHEEQEKDLLSEAARRGGDIVVVPPADSRYSSRPISKRDCAYWKTTRIRKEVWNYERQAYYPADTKQRECALYERVEGREGVLTLKGVLWRKEPVLSRQQLAGWRLVSAARKGNVAELNRLLAGGTDVNAGYDGRRAISVAATAGKLAVVKTLLAKGVDLASEDIAGTPLHAAAAGGHTEVVRFLIDRGAIIDARTTLGDETTIGVTPLFLAASNGHLGATRLLIARGADVNHSNEKGLTPLMLAGHADDATTVQALIAAGAKVNVASQPIPIGQAAVAYKITPLLSAVISNNSDGVAELLTHGAKPGYKLDKDFTVADFAADYPEINQLIKGYQEGVFGYVDRHGKAIVPMRYLSAEAFADGQAVVGNGTYRGTIDRNGRAVLAARFTHLETFSEGLATASVGGGWGHVDKSGKWVVPPIFSFARKFSEGLAPVSIPEGRWGYVEKSGELVIAPTLDNAFGFRDGVAAVKVGDHERFIDRSGSFVGGKFDVVGHFSEGFGRFKDGKEWGFVDTRGEVAIKPDFELALPFSEGKAVVRTGKNQYGYIDKTGKLVIAARYRDAEPFSEGRAAVRDEKGNWGVIDGQGREIVAPRFDKVEPFSEGLAAAEVRTPGAYPSTKVGFINLQGTMIISPRFLKARSFHEGLAAVKLAGKGIGGAWGFIDKTGKLVVPARYDWTMDFSEGRAWVRSRDQKAWVSQWRHFNRLDRELLAAAARNDSGRIVALLRQGANIEARGGQGVTPLGLATFAGQLSAVKTLLANGADVDARDRDGYTPLIRAASRGVTEAARLLVAHGADRLAVNNVGVDAVSMAFLFGYRETAQAILEGKGKPTQ